MVDIWLPVSSKPLTVMSLILQEISVALPISVGGNDMGLLFSASCWWHWPCAPTLFSFFGCLLNLLFLASSDFCWTNCLLGGLAQSKA